MPPPSGAAEDVDAQIDRVPLAFAGVFGNGDGHDDVFVLARRIDVGRGFDLRPRRQFVDGVGVAEAELPVVNRRRAGIGVDLLRLIGVVADLDAARDGYPRCHVVDDVELGPRVIGVLGWRVDQANADRAFRLLGARRSGRAEQCRRNKDGEEKATHGHV